MSADGPFDSDYARDYAGFLTCQRGDLIAEYISRRKRWASQWSDADICRVWLKLMGKRGNGEPDDPAWVFGTDDLQSEADLRNLELPWHDADSYIEAIRAHLVEKLDHMERHEPAAYGRLADAIQDGIAAYRDGLRN